LIPRFLVHTARSLACGLVRSAGALDPRGSRRQPDRPRIRGRQLRYGRQGTGAEYGHTPLPVTV